MRHTEGSVHDRSHFVRVAGGCAKDNFSVIFQYNFAKIIEK